MSLTATKCIVLNSTFEPLEIVSVKRALILVLEGKAIYVEEHPSIKIRSPKTSFALPLVIALKRFIKHRRERKERAQLSKKNLFIRDNYTCQYCKRTSLDLKNQEFLTRDHVHPRVRGGKTTWDNLVTACSSCNNKKANKTLTELDISLLNKPRCPSKFELWVKSQSHKNNILTKYFK